MLIALAVCVGVCALAGAGILTAVCVCAGQDYHTRPSDCVVGLGAHVWMDGTLSTSLLRRCEAALAAWEDGLAPAIIACGGQGGDEPDTEAEAVRDWLVARGVPPERIYLDVESVNTAQNLRNASAIMAANGFKTAAVCTNDYHLRRALWLARDMGIDACGLAARSPDNVVTLARSRLRESASWVLYFIRKLVGNG